MTLALGLMSGTSCDGISAALVRFHGRSLRVLAEQTQPYAAAFAQRLRQADELAAPALSALNMTLGELFGHAALRLLKRAGIAPRRIAVIGSHGHTVYHGPRDRIPSTLQLGEPAVIAERTGLPVIADFRMRDIAAGGGGAPLLPAFDEAFFGNGPVRAMQNIGGIANVAVVGRGLRPLAFDTGPGNCLIDLLAQQASRGRLRFDADGHLARRGCIDRRAVARLWRHPYFRLPPPKSTGRELFNAAWLRDMLGPRYAAVPADALATLTYFTAYAIAESLKRFAPKPPRELIVSGGGVRNRTLMDHLTSLAAPARVRSIERYGIPAQAKEPAAFAWLALRTLQGRVNHLPHTTGARRARILGAMTPRAP
ncbi:MAG: anhydro-N-acetylmuramic acid kinase [Omnitrophica WOR_2 bacterium RIFCSPHIGHO2_02_FULL_67_20]|nr:MAG: anhydro-N-acetylmuramic acid kinase [Omnitrophica WOR_2 bacterium RIFCSPHIGHO2_02_FULL_67_20]